MENDGRVKHTHTDSLLQQAENKPNFHTRKRVKQNKKEIIEVPNSNPNAIVLTNSGKSSDGDEHFDIFEFADKIGAVITDKHIEMANKIRNDPEHKAQVKKEWIARLQAKKRRHVVSNMNAKVSSVYNDNLETIKQIVAYIRNKDIVGIVADGTIGIAEGYATKEDFEQAVRAIYRVSDKRVVNDKIKMLEAAGIITGIIQGHVVYGKPHSRTKVDAYKINAIDKL